MRSAGRSSGAGRSFAVALHDVEPATFERCAEIREWLAQHGVERMTLLAIPARDLHPLGERSQEVARWLTERERAGDAIAQHGFQHTEGRGRLSGRGRPQQEFAGLDSEQARRAVDAGRRVLKLAGIEPRGFVAPGYAYTPALREALEQRFQWWAELFAVQRVLPAPCLGPHLRVPSGGLRTAPSSLRETLPPPLAPASTARVQRCLARALTQLETRVGEATVRLDVHPRDFDRAASVKALARALSALREDRRAITYDDLALHEPASAGAPRQTQRRLIGRVRQAQRTRRGAAYPPEKRDALKGFTSERPA
jgi:predicted deacetylase